MNWNRDKSLSTLLAVALGATVLMLFGLLPAPVVRPNPKPDDPPIVSGPSAQYVICLRNIDKPTADSSAVLDGPQARALKLAGRMIVRPVNDSWASDKRYTTMLDESKTTIVFAIDELGHLVGKPHRPTDERAFAEWCADNVKELPKPKVEYLRAERVADPGDPHDVKHDDDGKQYVEVDGHKRYLTARSAPNKLQVLGKYSDFNVLIPQSQWRDVVRDNLFPGEDWIMDQDGIGECVGCGWAGAARRMRRLEGSSDVMLSSAMIYSQINGGEDNGAIISDGIEAMTRVGTCPFSLLGIKPFYTHQIPQAAKDECYRFRTLEVYRCDEWEELCSGIQVGFIPVYGYMVGNNLGKWDKYGVAGHDRGPGNHCNCGEGMRKLPNGKWVVIDVNSWGYGWGPFKNGKVYLDKEHLFGGGDMADVCLIRSMRRDPKDGVDPPALRTK